LALLIALFNGCGNDDDDDDQIFVFYLARGAAVMEIPLY